MEAIYQDKIYNADCLEVLKEMPGNSIDLLVTDPPYGISFMGKSWDKALPDKRVWVECLRVLKDGAFAFVMSIPRVDCLSRMIISLEDAGFMVNFTPVFWVYASGFPKAQNIGKAIDKRLGVKRKFIGEYTHPDGKKRNWTQHSKSNTEIPFGHTEGIERNITLPATPQAKALDGSYGGMQLKPSVEVIIVAQKPKTEKIYVDQALLWYEERQEVLRGLASELKVCYNIDSVEWEK